MAVTARYDQEQLAPARGLGAILDFATRSHARAAAVLVLVALLNFLPGFTTIPPIDRDEARFAQATKQMIENRDYIDIRSRTRCATRSRSASIGCRPAW
jgi:hypothetical protein